MHEIITSSIDSSNVRMAMLVKEMAKAENVTASLKAENQIEWRLLAIETLLAFFIGTFR